jgi:lysophospholipid acyltransferase (LPLAT)-like uncharacterized protein
MKIPIDPVKLTPLIALIYRLWIRSLRYVVHGDLTRFLQLHDSGQPMVLALWHGELFPVTGFGEKVDTNLVTFVSQSRDGEVIARVLETMGHVTVRGSSSRGGVKALVRAIRVMERENRMAVFTVDGPRGPRHKAKGGVIYLAQRAEAIIVPFRAFPEKRKVFSRSWDRFVLPAPFTRCHLYIGEPMEVTSDKLTGDVLQREQERLEERMLALGPESA